MKCPNCKSESIKVKWNEVPSNVGYCPICDRIFILNEGETVIIYDFQSKNKVEAEIPILPLGTPIYITNKEHKFFLEFGYIREKDHKHYRINFISLNEEIHNTYLWVPDHWIAPIPKELRKMT